MVTLYFLLCLFFSITYSLVSVLKKKWAEHFSKEAKESGRKVLRVNGQNLGKKSNRGMQLGDEPAVTIPCPLQRTNTQGPYSTLL